MALVRLHRNCTETNGPKSNPKFAQFFKTASGSFAQLLCSNCVHGQWGAKGISASHMSVKDPHGKSLAQLDLVRASDASAVYAHCTICTVCTVCTMTLAPSVILCQNCGLSDTAKPRSSVLSLSKFSQPNSHDFASVLNKAASGCMESITHGQITA